jgi:hypothetical protein
VRLGLVAHPLSLDDGATAARNDTLGHGVNGDLFVLGTRPRITFTPRAAGHEKTRVTEPWEPEGVGLDLGGCQCRAIPAKSTADYDRLMRARPNKITGANAGGPRPFPSRTGWAARIAQCRRSAGAGVKSVVAVDFRNGMIDGILKQHG